jgi:hypothetical protein
MVEPAGVAPRTPTQWRRRPRRTVVAVGVAALLSVVPACGSGGLSGPSSSSSISPEDCPFSGSTDPIEGGDEAAGPALLTGLATSKNGCVDRLRFDLDPGAGPWRVAYAEGAVVADDGTEVVDAATAALVVTLDDTLDGTDHAATEGAGAPPGAVTELELGGLDYVRAVRVVDGVEDDDELIVVVVLDQRLPFEASDDDDPPSLTLELG